MRIKAAMTITFAGLALATGSLHAQSTGTTEARGVPTDAGRPRYRVERETRHASQARLWLRGREDVRSLHDGVDVRCGSLIADICVVSRTERYSAIPVCPNPNNPRCNGRAQADGAARESQADRPY